jgi:hypothetical protein
MRVGVLFRIRPFRELGGALTQRRLRYLEPEIPPSIAGPTAIVKEECDMKQIWVHGTAAEGEPLPSAWAPETGMFQPSQELVYVTSGNATLSHRLTPLAPYELMVKPHRRGYPSRWGLLVRSEDLQAARQELSATELQRARQRAASQRRREQREATYREAFRAEVQRQFPRAPAETLDQIVAPATKVGSGRVGRSRQVAQAEAVFLTVQAWVRHQRTKYGRRLAAGLERWEARDMVGDQVERLLKEWGWTGPAPGTSGS